MQLEHRSCKILITGRSGTGKTTYFLRYLTHTPARVKFVFDQEGEIAYRWKHSAALNPNALAQSISSGYVLYDPSSMFPGQTPEAFAFFCEWSFRTAQQMPGRKLFCCDELQKLVGTNRVSPELALVLETGRRYGLDALMIAQQPNLIHNRIRNQVSEVVTFQQMDAAAVGFLAQTGFREDEVRALRPGQWIARNLHSGGEARGRLF